MNAFGHEGFCACLNAELDWRVDFETYIRIVTANALDTHPNDAAYRKAVDSAYAAQAKCVQQ